MDRERKKRTRPDQGDREKKIKLPKRQSEQDRHSSDSGTNLTITAAGFGGTSYSSSYSDDVAEGLGVFDFPWLKDGGGVSRSPEEWKLEDSFVSQLGESNVESVTTITTPTGIEFSLTGQCSLPQVISDPFFGAELCPSSLQDFGFEAAESLDYILSAFT